MMAASAELAQAAVVEADFIAAWWLLAEVGGHDLHDDPDLRWFHTGADDPYLNAVLGTWLPPRDADAVIDRMLEELRRRGAPFLWWHMPSSSPPDLGTRLVDRGLVEDGSWPGMTLQVDELVEPPAVPGLTIRRVADDAALDTYLEIFAPILSMSPAFTSVFAESSRRTGYADDVPEIHFLGELDGEPVATVSLLTAGGAAGIYNVTTLERVRGLGIGAAMTAAAVTAGRERELRTATLQASTMGRRIYERLGFRYACDLIPYRSSGQPE